MWGKHLWPLLQAVLQQVVGSDNVTVVDDRFSLLPRWPGLHNLEKVFNITFADGETHFDIMKVRVFV